MTEGRGAELRAPDEPLTRRQHTLERAQPETEVAPPIRQRLGDTQLPRKPLDVTHVGPAGPADRDGEMSVR